MLIEKRPSRCHQIEPTIAIDIFDRKPLRTRSKLRHRDSLVLAAQLVEIQNARMVRVADHQIKSLAVGLQAERSRIDGVTGDEGDVSRVIREPGRALIAQEDLFVAEKQQV